MSLDEVERIRFERVKDFSAFFTRVQTCIFPHGKESAMSLNHLLEKLLPWDSYPTDTPIVPPLELIAFFVRCARGLRQWKQSTLADFAGVSLSTVERVERGERVSNECLDRIAVGLGYARGYFTEPRIPRPPQDAATEMVKRFGELEPVKVQPLRTHSQVRTIADCHGFLIHRPNVGEAYDGHVCALTEWLDLASFILGSPDVGAAASEDGCRRELYNSILACVQDIEQSGLTVLCGMVDAPQEGFSDWKIAVVSFTPKISDPGARKRRVLLVDRRCLKIPAVAAPHS
jgi:transcriptional regulator with XRE-family HTH domain